MDMVECEKNLHIYFLDSIILNNVAKLGTKTSTGGLYIKNKYIL